MHVHTFECFGARPGQGNPALVIEDDGLDPAGRQAFAAARNTTCVFLSPQREVDYVYPHARSPLCLHATLAVAALLFGREPRAATIGVRTAMTKQLLTLSREDGAYFVRLAAQPAPRVAITDAELAVLLDAPGLAPVAAPQAASVGSPKLLVEVADAQTLYALQPDLAGIAAWGKANGVNGMYVYCRLDRHAFEGRNFNHFDAALEDSATGVAAGALAAALQRSLVLRQGRARGRDCLIAARIEAGAILVGGAVAAVQAA